MKVLLFFIVLTHTFAQNCHETLIKNSIGDLRSKGKRKSDVSMQPPSSAIIAQKYHLHISGIFYCTDDTRGSLTSLQMKLSSKDRARNKLMHKFKTADESNSSCFMWSMPEDQRIKYIKPTYVISKKTGMRILSMLFVTDKGYGRTLGKVHVATRAVRSVIWSFDTRKARNFIGLFSVENPKTAIVRGVGPLIDICGGKTSKELRKMRKQNKKKIAKLPRVSTG